MACPQIANGRYCYEYVEEAVADSQQGVVLQLGCGRGASNSQQKTRMLRNVTQGLGERSCAHGNGPSDFVKWRIPCLFLRVAKVLSRLPVGTYITLGDHPSAYL
jgi:hypothetical protein